jgi:hypothetical protein
MGWLCRLRGYCYRPHLRYIGYVDRGFTLYQCKRCNRVHFSY